MFFKKQQKIEEPIRIDRKVHMLTLDGRWHDLFVGIKKPRYIAELEKKLTKLLAEQGQLTNDIREYGLLKKKMMGDIMENMKDAFEESDSRAMKEMDKSKKYIEEIKGKLENMEERSYSLPKEIEEVNKELLTYTMQNCYMRMYDNKQELEELEAWIERVRQELKDKLVRQTEAKEEYDKLYSYMHDLVGYEIIEKYDKKYLGGKG